MPSVPMRSSRKFILLGAPIESDFITGMAVVEQRSAAARPLKACLIGTAPDFLVSRWINYKTDSNNDGLFALGIANKGYILKFGPHVEFYFDKTKNEIFCLPSVDADQPLIQHLFLNQVLPRILAYQGSIILHASALTLGSAAFAFCGESGSGKSTLIASYSNQEVGLLTDDCLRVDISGEAVKAIPSSHGIRLTHESWHQLSGSGSMPQHASNCSKKILLDSSDFQFEHPHINNTLRSIFILHPTIDANEPPNITPLSKQQAAHELLKHSFRLDYTNHLSLKHEFKELVNLTQHTPVFRLSFSHNWKRLDKLNFLLMNYIVSIKSSN